MIPPPEIEHPAQERQERSPVGPIRPGVVGRHLDRAARTVGAGFCFAIGAGPGDAVGVCVSGGGIRSATVALGALHALREAGHPAQGGLPGVGVRRRLYGWRPPAGHDQGDRRPAARSGSRLRATAADAFAPGSPEEDHLRRHSSYIADGLGQWLVALGVLLRGVLSSLIIIGLTITTLGLAIGAFYRHVPITAGGNLPPPKFAVTGSNVSAPAYPAIPAGVWYAIAVAAGLTLLAYLARQLAAGREAWRRRTSRGAMILLAATLLLAALGVALPALLWASSWVTWKLGFSLRPAAAVSSLTVVTTYLGAVVALFWRNRTTIAKTAGTVTSAASKADRPTWSCRTA